MKNSLSCFLFAATLFTGITAAACTRSTELPDVPIIFHYQHHTHYLGFYLINLAPTLSAIENDSANAGPPYFKKKWYGKCPRQLHAKKCFEFTVYPDANNFTPESIMQRIEKYTHGKPNRGEVRVMTNKAETKYIYTTNHYRKFCGPYQLV